MLLNPFDIDRLTPSPWKNGGGTTREIVVWPRAAGLDDFDWRVSIASISASGPFSTFQGIDRVIMLLEGDGVHLSADGGNLDHRLDRRWVPFPFSGEIPIDCALLGGPSTDFNLMSRRDRVDARLDLVSGQREHAADTPPAIADGPRPIAEGLVLALRGEWRIDASDPATAGGGVTQRFGAGRGFWWSTPGDARGQASPLVDLRSREADAWLLRVTISRRPPVGAG